MRRFILLLAILSAFAGAGAARADGKIGIVLMHGKLGLPLGVSQGRAPAIGRALVDALQEAGYLVAVPELCWSRRRSFDLAYTDCFRDIDAAIAELKRKGATAIVVGGQSLGGNAALGYGATHRGLLGIIGLAPADDPGLKAGRPSGAASIARAQALMAQGKGDEVTTFEDRNTGAGGSYPILLSTTARIFLSFSGPDAPSSLPGNAAKLTAPLLWVAGDRDPTQVSGPGFAFDHAPHHPLNRYVRVSASHLETPDAAVGAVLAWLRELAKS